MSKYDTIRMAELVSVNDMGDTLELIFSDDKRIRITASGDTLVSEVS